jgi:hypothetical protein
MSISAWLSIGSTQSACSASWCSDSTLLYGDVMTSSTSLGKTLTAKRYSSGCSSASISRRYEPRPEPVPPPNECIRKKDCGE